MISFGADRRSGIELSALFFCLAHFDSSQQVRFAELLGGGCMHRGSMTLRAVLVLLAVWCIGSTPAVGQDAPVRGGTIVVAIVSDPGHLNPAITTSGATHAASE